MERMKRLAHLEVHDVHLHTVGPLFIGDGTEIKAHRLLVDRERNEVGIIALPALARWLAAHHAMDDWGNFLLEKASDVRPFFARLGQKEAASLLVDRWRKLSRPLAPNEEVQSVRPFLRHLNGTAYVPASTLKGAVSTALMVWRLKEMAEKEKESLRAVIRESLTHTADFADAPLRHTLFHILAADPSKRHNPWNSLMRTYAFADSDPVPETAYCLVARDDEGERGPAPQRDWREAVRPGTTIHTRLTIDMGLMGRSGSMLTVLNEALSHWQVLEERVYHDRIFVKDRAPVDRRTLSIYLGGGAGFVNKTVLFALFSEEEARHLTNDCLSQTHAHYDARYAQKVAPYNRHLARIQKDDRALAYDMGKCKVSINY